jgi:RNA polymerase sigma-70 factor (ECF subfamily)
MDPNERPPEIGEWLRLVRLGDEAAARRLVEYLNPLVFKIVRGHLPRRVGEEDIAQEVFMKIFRKLDQFRGEQPFEHWVARVAHNTCLDLLRYQQRRPELRWADLSEEQAEVLENTVQDVAAVSSSTDGEAREIVHKILEQLSPEDRLVITMLDLEQKSVAEIRAVTGWGASLVKVRAYRARLKLRKHLQQLLGEREYALGT